MPASVYRTAVMIPCHNEAIAIGKVVDDFRAQLPEAAIYVFDNCCTDDTAAVAAQHGAIVVKEPRKGKGMVVEKMLERVEADYYVMVDGDDTYPAEAVHDLLGPVMAGDADMTVGARLSQFTAASFRPLHVMGNHLIRWLINHIFGANLTDVLSGYRAFNRSVAQKLPILSYGFEIETELTVNMLYYRLKIIEVNVPYRERSEGSQSKLRTFHDGARVLWKIFSLLRAYKPLSFFGGAGLVLMALSLLAGILPVWDYIAERYVRHVPLAILAVGLMGLALGSAAVGLILHAMNWRFRELHSVVSRAEVHAREAARSRESGAAAGGGQGPRKAGEA